jgi:hypothetical protein
MIQFLSIYTKQFLIWRFSFCFLYLGLGGVFLLYTLLPVYLYAIRTQGTIIKLEEPCSYVAYTDLNGITQTYCEQINENNIFNDKHVIVWYLSKNPKKIIHHGEFSFIYIILVYLSIFLFLLASIFSSLKWHFWRINKFCLREELIINQIDYVYPWNNPFGFSSCISNCLVTFKITVSDHTGRKFEGWIKYGKFWYVSLDCQVLWKDRIPGVIPLEEILEERRQSNKKLLISSEAAENPNDKLLW